MFCFYRISRKVKMDFKTSKTIRKILVENHANQSLVKLIFFVIIQNKWPWIKELRIDSVPGFNKHPKILSAYEKMLNYKNKWQFRIMGQIYSICILRKVYASCLKTVSCNYFLKYDIDACLSHKNYIIVTIK